ncbi:hypothetical protein MNBD_ALPHA02-2408 [hydrothermal vent metagenome]|uniref:Uncharacterized protein n=1 Tax=hydrothermal vent metagenome TaxID=652676 RepID=A0A3B0RWL6_9ZZZZ
MIYGHKWCALPAVFHIIAPEIIYQRDITFTGQKLLVHDLPCPAIIRPAEQGLAMETDNINIPVVQIIGFQDFGHGFGVMPSLSIKAQSAPSIEVQLIYPMAKK